MIRPKKQLGQHFLKDEKLAETIVNSLSCSGSYCKVLEIGPGMGILTRFLLANPSYETYVIDIDAESANYLQIHYPQLGQRIIHGDFLQLDLKILFNEPCAIIGNFPYNISTEILFKILAFRDSVPEVVGMFQKEVAERIVAKPGGKVYGIPSVLLQAFFDTEYLFSVGSQVFNPPPKVNSAVIRLTRNGTKKLNCNEILFTKLVKAGFGQRRKTLRNAIRQFLKPGAESHVPFLQQRAETLSCNEFVELANAVEKII